MKFGIVYLTLLTLMIPLIDSREDVVFTVAVYRDQAYKDYFDALIGISEEEVLKVHASGMKYFLSDNSLEPRIHVKFLLRDTLFSFKENGISTDKFLEIFSAFHNEERKASEVKWNHAVLLTGNTSKPDGLTYIGGFCSENNSSSVIKARDLHLTPLRGVQYIARNMGMSWDAGAGYIMSQTPSPGVFQWSKESQDFWRTYASTKKVCWASSIDSTNETDFLSFLPGLRVHAHLQCQAAHGQDFKMSSTRNDSDASSSSLCKELRCHSNSTVQGSLHVAPLPGSACYKLKYCWKAECQSLTSILHEINADLLRPKDLPLPGPTYVKVVLNSFLKVIRLINFLYNRS